MDWRQLPAAGPHLQNMYTELRQGSKKAVVVVKKGTAYLRPSGRSPQWPGQLQQPHYLSHQWKPSYRRELGCPHSTEHMIKVMDDTPFKEWFRKIPLPLVEAVWNHLQETLESGAIWPSQSAWYNAVVLVRKKDGCLWFCINFCHLKRSHEKGLLPSDQNTRGVGKFGRCWTFFLLGP